MKLKLFLLVLIIGNLSFNNSLAFGDEWATSNVEFVGEKAVIKRKKKEVFSVSKQEISQQTVKYATVSNLFADPINSLKILPGVASNGSFSALMYVRGGGGNEVLTVVDNHYFQYPYFWGGRVSIINPKLVDTITFYSGGFPARYGQMLSGVIDVKTINGAQKK